jgi:hypothetical protein
MTAEAENCGRGRYGEKREEEVREGRGKDALSMYARTRN